MKFKTLVSKIKVIFNDKVGEGPHPYFLNCLEEVKDIPDIINQLMGYLPSGVFMIDNFVTLAYTLNGLLEHCRKRDTSYLDINVDNDGGHFEVHFVHLIMDFDKEAMVEEFNELSDANQDVQSVTMRCTIEAHVEKIFDSMSVKNPEDKPDEEKWTTAGKSKTMSPAGSTTTDNKATDNSKDENHFHVLSDEHDDDRPDKFENFDSTEMEQSIESIMSLESLKTKKKKSNRQKLLNRPDQNYRKKVGRRSIALLKRVTSTL